MARFVNNVPHADRRSAALPALHPAMVEGRTLFPRSVIDASDAPRLLVPGFNSSKIGGRIIKGPWARLQIYTLTLEERATCPTTCGLLRECFGNSSPFSRRHRDDGTMVERLGVEISALLQQHRRGIAVRLHVLGDFATADYARAWLAWVKHYPKLHVFGFTAWQPGTEIGTLVLSGNKRFSGRWSIRCSVGPTDRIAPMQATTIWRQPEADNVPEGLVCPASTHKTSACGTCALCWSPAMKDKRIVFVGHGMNKSSSARRSPDTATEKRIAFAGGAAAVAHGMGFQPQAILRWGKTDRVPAGSMEAFEALCDDLGRRKSEEAVPFNWMRASDDERRQRTSEIENLARAGVYRAEIAKRVDASLRTVEQTITDLRRNRDDMPAPTPGPHAAVDGIDWDEVATDWYNPEIPTSQILGATGCSERTIYRRLGNRNEGSMQTKSATPSAVRQCENLAIEPTDDDFRQAVADIAWTQANPTDHRAVLLHPDPGSRETWRVYLGGSEVDVLFQPSSKVIVGVAMVRGYAKCSARKGRMPAPRVLEPASNPARSVAAPPAPKPPAPFRMSDAPPQPDYAPKAPVYAPKAPEQAQRVVQAAVHAASTGVRTPVALKQSDRWPSDHWDWTPERDAVLKEHYPTGMPIEEIRQKLKALCGTIGSDAAVNTRAVQQLKLRRPPTHVPNTRRLLPHEKRAERDARIEMRDDIIRQGYEEGLDDAAILAKVHEVDPKILLRDIATMARSLKVERPTIEAVNHIAEVRNMVAADVNSIEPDVAETAPDVNPEAQIVASEPDVPVREGHDGLTLALATEPSSPATEPAISAPDLQIDASGQRANGSGQRAPMSISAPSEEVEKTDIEVPQAAAPIPEHRKNGHAQPEPAPVAADPFLQMLLDEERWLAAKLAGVRHSIDLYRRSDVVGDSTDTNQSGASPQASDI